MNNVQDSNSIVSPFPLIKFWCCCWISKQNSEWIRGTIDEHMFVVWSHLTIEGLHKNTTS